MNIQEKKKKTYTGNEFTRFQRDHSWVIDWRIVLYRWQEMEFQKKKNLGTAEA